LLTSEICLQFNLNRSKVVVEVICSHQVLMPVFVAQGRHCQFTIHLTVNFTSLSITFTTVPHLLFLCEQEKQDAEVTISSERDAANVQSQELKRDLVQGHRLAHVSCVFQFFYKGFGCVVIWLHRVLLLKKSVATEYLPTKKLPKFWHV